MQTVIRFSQTASLPLFVNAYIHALRGTPLELRVSIPHYLFHFHSQQRMFYSARIIGPPCFPFHALPQITLVRVIIHLLQSARARASLCLDP